MKNQIFSKKKTNLKVRKLIKLIKKALEKLRKTYY